MKSTKNDVTKVVCNNCKKSNYSVSGKGSSGMKTYFKGKELGWHWINKQNQICPDCIAKEKASKKTAPKAIAKKAAKSKVVPERKPITLFGKKVIKPNGAQPVGGQSIGKLARSAKITAATASE